MPSRFTFRDIDKGMKGIVRELSKSDRPHVNVGVLSDAGKYAQFTELKKSKGKLGKGKLRTSQANLADVATWMEFGTRSIPKRPFMKKAFDENYDRIIKFIDAQYKQVVDGKQTTEEGLKKIGVFFEGMVKKKIVSGEFKALSPATVKRKRKGSSKPLIDTGRLRTSINHRVVLKGEGGGTE